MAPKEKNTSVVVAKETKNPVVSGKVSLNGSTITKDSSIQDIYLSIDYRQSVRVVNAAKVAKEEDLLTNNTGLMTAVMNHFGNTVEKDGKTIVLQQLQTSNSPANTEFRSKVAELNKAVKDKFVYVQFDSFAQGNFKRPSIVAQVNVFIPKDFEDFFENAISVDDVKGMALIRKFLGDTLLDKNAYDEKTMFKKNLANIFGLSTDAAGLKAFNASAKIKTLLATVAEDIKNTPVILGNHGSFVYGTKGPIATFSKRINGEDRLFFDKNLGSVRVLDKDQVEITSNKIFAQQVSDLGIDVHYSLHRNLNKPAIGVEDENTPFNIFSDEDTNEFAVYNLKSEATLYKVSGVWQERGTVYFFAMTATPVKGEVIEKKEVTDEEMLAVIAAEVGGVDKAEYKLLVLEAKQDRQVLLDKYAEIIADNE